MSPIYTHAGEVKRSNVCVSKQSIEVKVKGHKELKEHLLVICKFSLLVFPLPCPNSHSDLVVTHLERGQCRGDMLLHEVWEH